MAEIGDRNSWWLAEVDEAGQHTREGLDDYVAGHQFLAWGSETHKIRETSKVGKDGTAYCSMASAEMPGSVPRDNDLSV